MNLPQYILATLRHYWRTNAAIVAGIAAATAVIGGALLVGASMRSSLEKMTLERLARVDHVLTGGRFFREELADELSRRFRSVIIVMDGETRGEKDGGIGEIQVTWSGRLLNALGMIEIARHRMVSHFSTDPEIVDE